MAGDIRSPLVQIPAGAGESLEGGMSKDSVMQMLDEIAAGLKAGDRDVYGWLRDQLENCGGSEISVDLAMGVITRLLPDDARDSVSFGACQSRRLTH
jgi:hypothetical protein